MNIPLSEKYGGETLERTYEQKLEDEADLRVAIAYLRAELQKANREGRELHIELWTNKSMVKEKSTSLKLAK